MTDVTCRLTAKKRDQLRNPSLGNRVWATFTFTSFYVNISIKTRNTYIVRILILLDSFLLIGPQNA